MISPQSERVYFSTEIIPLQAILFDVEEDSAALNYGWSSSLEGPLLNTNSILDANDQLEGFTYLQAGQLLFLGGFGFFGKMLLKMLLLTYWRRTASPFVKS